MDALALVNVGVQTGADLIKTGSDIRGVVLRLNKVTKKFPFCTNYFSNLSI